MPDAVLWEYGARLTSHLQAGGVDLADQAELRARSSKIAFAAAIDELDDQLLAFVKDNRPHRDVFIDSHPVTREAHGFRITAFSHDRFRELAPNEIWLFFASPLITIERITNDPAGRPLIDVETARMHTFLQGSVAATYGIAAGCPVYLFDTGRERSDILADLSVRMRS